MFTVSKYFVYAINFWNFDFIFSMYRLFSIKGLILILIVIIVLGIILGLIPLYSATNSNKISGKDILLYIKTLWPFFFESLWIKGISPPFLDKISRKNLFIRNQLHGI